MRTLRGWRWQGLAALLLLLVLAAAGCGGDDGGGSKDDAPAEQTVEFQEPEDPGPDPFTEPADVEGSEEVSLQETGGSGGAQPYGGSGSDKVCDRDKLVRFLRKNPDRMREWARVVGIAPSYKAVSKYIAKLHPVTLTRDTQVTNHSFVDGRAVPFQAILQAGTAVLVDDYGRPVARCRCGNPLAKPVYVRSAKCVGCPANYKPPRQCKLYVRRVNYSRDAYTGDYYRNDEYDAVFVDASRSGPYKDCYTAYPDPPVVTIVNVYREPPPEPEVQEATPPPETTPEPEPNAPNCENPRSQYEYEQCHPPQEEPAEPQPDPNYDCPDQPPAHPGEDYLRNCPG